MQTPFDRATWDAWERIGVELADPSIELTPEEFAIFLLLFRQLQRQGAAFDAAICSLIDCLERQLRDSSEDSDSDGFDETLEPQEDQNLWT
jgi:hypothetical protein